MTGEVGGVGGRATRAVIDMLIQLANERAVGTSNQIGASVGEWNYTAFNPRAASTGSTKGTIGSVGTTEVLIAAGQPVLVGGIYFESDSQANEAVLLRDAAATATSITNRAFTADKDFDGLKFLSGLCVCGTHINVCALIKWRVYVAPPAA